MDADKSRPNGLRQQRLLRGWTQDEVADRLYKLCGSKGSIRGDINANMVSRWENGKHPPSPFWQSKLCELYGKNAEELGLHIVTWTLSGGNICSHKSYYVDILQSPYINYKDGCNLHLVKPLRKSFQIQTADVE